MPPEKILGCAMNERHGDAVATIERGAGEDHVKAIELFSGAGGER